MAKRQPLTSDEYARQVNRCPVCTSKNIEGTGSDQAEDTRDIKCNDCHSYWVEDLGPVGYHNLHDATPEEPKPTVNPFELYADTPNHRVRLAEVTKAIQDDIENSIQNVRLVIDQNVDLGASDTASREAIYQYWRQKVAETLGFA